MGGFFLARDREVGPRCGKMDGANKGNAGIKPVRGCKSLETRVEILRPKGKLLSYGQSLQ